MLHLAADSGRLAFWRRGALAPPEKFKLPRKRRHDVQLLLFRRRAKTQRAVVVDVTVPSVRGEIVIGGNRPL